MTAFVLYLIQLVLYVTARVQEENEDLLKKLWVGIQVVDCLVLLTWIYGFVIRFTKSGEYCSARNLASWGNFIAVAFWIFIILAVLAGLSLIFGKSDEEDKE